MATAYETTTERQMVEVLVQFLRGIAFADRLWVSPGYGRLTFWLKTMPVSHEQERTVYAANSLIYQNVPGARFDFLVINPAMYDEPFDFEPPAGAEEILLR